MGFSSGVTRGSARLRMPNAVSSTATAPTTPGMAASVAVSASDCSSVSRLTPAPPRPPTSSVASESHAFSSSAAALMGRGLLVMSMLTVLPRFSVVVGRVLLFRVRSQSTQRPGVVQGTRERADVVLHRGDVPDRLHPVGLHRVAHTQHQVSERAPAVGVHLRFDALHDRSQRHQDLLDVVEPLRDPGYRGKTRSALLTEPVTTQLLQR